MKLIWILLICLSKSQSAFIRKDDPTQTNYAEDKDSILDNIEILQLQDTPSLKESKESVKEEGQNLEDSLLKIMYQQSAWEQLVATADVWEVTGDLSRKLNAVSPAEIENEDASFVLDYILSTVKPFLNNSRAVADAGTALNMNNCSVNGIMEGLQRDGPAKLSVNDDLATLIFSITTKTLKMSCNWHQWVMIKYYGVVSATISTITVETVVDMKLQPDQHPVIKKMTVKELGDISSDITGVGPLGILVRTIINKIIGQYRVMLIDALEQQAPIAMQVSLDNITIPNSENITSTLQTSLNNIKFKLDNASKNSKNTDNSTIPNSENITSTLNDEVDSQQNINPVEDKEDENNNNRKITEKFVEESDEDNGKADESIETQVENTNSDRTKEEDDLLLLNEYGKNIHPKLIKVKNTNKNKNDYKDEEETDLNLLNDHETNIHPKFRLWPWQ